MLSLNKIKRTIEPSYIIINLSLHLRKMASSDSTEKIVDYPVGDGEETILSSHTSTSDCEFEELPTHNFPSADLSPDDITSSNPVEPTSITQQSESKTISQFLCPFI